MAQYLNRARFNQAGGTLAFGSVGAGYASLYVVSGIGRKLIITNSLDKQTVLSFDGGTTDFIKLPAGQGLVIDFDTSLQFGNITISVKHDGVAPTVGSINANVIYAL